MTQKVFALAAGLWLVGSANLAALPVGGQLNHIVEDAASGSHGHRLRGVEAFFSDGTLQASVEAVVWQPLTDPTTSQAFACLTLEEVPHPPPMNGEPGPQQLPGGLSDMACGAANIVLNDDLGGAQVQGALGTLQFNLQLQGQGPSGPYSANEVDRSVVRAEAGQQRLANGQGLVVSSLLGTLSAPVAQARLFVGTTTATLIPLLAAPAPAHTCCENNTKILGVVRIDGFAGWNATGHRFIVVSWEVKAAVDCRPPPEDPPEKCILKFDAFNSILPSFGHRRPVQKTPQGDREPATERVSIINTHETYECQRHTKGDTFFVNYVAEFPEPPPAGSQVKGKLSIEIVGLGPLSKNSRQLNKGYLLEIDVNIPAGTAGDLRPTHLQNPTITPRR